MENSSLNKAHQQQRRAEALLRQRKFDDCIECHRQAVELLEDACNLTENVRSLESLRLQKNYHLKQIDMVKLKIAQTKIDNYRKTVQLQKRKISLPSSEADTEEGLGATIYRTIEVHDSLIDYLGKRGGSDNDSVKSYSTSDNEEKLEKETAQIIGNKHPKDDSQIIEELKVLSGQLRDSVKCLLLQLDDRNREIEKLRATIRVLEGEKQKARQAKNNSSLKVVTDSSGGTSPYIFSPCSELSPDVVNDSRSLPPLAPLEMPNFDFLSFIKSNSTNNNNTENSQ
ncbi:unnamed protein product [Psylliodes chrysocephalus]|uniref:Nuclear receptor-binding factor 2 MIT domain-containing protein n=1 Tax=Psylliodes chrysocephalus TaxID=3402493 RepID=A0A9P0CUL9_9CUCU|nr:unnamed protein product [Psylliodes chrysocephala]